MRSVEYRYYANAAYAICEGEITRVGRIWADGKELDQSDYTIRVYRGDEDQTADGLIAGKEGGSDETPAYRGTAYIVFENMPLANFGNRLPQLNFEVFRAVDDFETLVRAVTLIPSAGEFVYEDDSVIRVDVRPDDLRESAYRAGRHRLEGRAQSARGSAPQCRPSVAWW